MRSNKNTSMLFVWEIKLCPWSGSCLLITSMSVYPSLPAPTAQLGQGSTVLNLMSIFPMHFPHHFITKMFRHWTVFWGIPAKPLPKSAINILPYLLYHKSISHEFFKISVLWVVSFSLAPFWLSDWPLRGTCCGQSYWVQLSVISGHFSLQLCSVSQ